jgi:hypothetical protein
LQVLVVQDLQVLVPVRRQHQELMQVRVPTVAAAEADFLQQQQLVMTELLVAQI